MKKYTKTFFPADWSVKEIIKKSQEALTNIIKISDLKADRYIIVGQTYGGSEIRFIFDTKGNLITFYPITLGNS